MSKTLPPLPALPPAEVQEWSESWITLRGEGWTRETVEKYASDYALAAIEAQGVPDCKVVDVGFRWDADRQEHVPSIKVEFAPVKANSQNDAKGWKDRDALAAMLAAAPPAPQPQQPGAWSERIKELADQYAIECVEFSKSIPNGAHSMSPIAVKAGDTRLDLHSAIDTAERLIRAIESATLAAQVERATQPQPVRCKYCDGTGDVHSITGEWRGACVCEAGKAPQPQPVQPTNCRHCGGPENVLCAGQRRPAQGEKQ